MGKRFSGQRISFRVVSLSWIIFLSAGSGPSPGVAAATSPEMPSDRAPRPPDELPAGIAARDTDISVVVPFTGRRASWPIAFAYPQSWHASEEVSRQPTYQQALLLGPRNPADSFTTTVVVRVMPTRAQGGEYAGLADLIAWRRTQHATASAFRLLANRRTSLAGLEGTELEFEYSTRVGQGTVGTKPVGLRTRLLALSDGKRLYEFIITSDQAEYDRYQPAFARLLESVRLTR